MRGFLTFVFVFFVFARLCAQDNIQWIANASFSTPANTSLYDLCKDDKPVILAVGNIHSRATESLLETHVLQSLARQHGAPRDMYSMGDLHVAFLNITIFPGDEEAGKTTIGVTVYNLPESSEALNTDGWDELYKLNTTGLFLLTPDHLIYPLSGTNADGVYAEARAHFTKLHPADVPDIRLLAVRREDVAKEVVVTVQNFSKKPALQVRITLRDASGKEVAAKDFRTSIAPLEAVPLSLPLPDAFSAGNVQIAASVAGDVNASNNVWNGSLQPQSQPVVAGMSNGH